MVAESAEDGQGQVGRIELHVLQVCAAAKEADNLLIADANHPKNERVQVG